MPRLKSTLSKANIVKVNKLCNKLAEQNHDINSEELFKKLEKNIINNSNSIKEISEKELVELYCNCIPDVLNPEKYPFTDDDFSKLNKNIRNIIIKNLTSEEFDNNIDIYFNEVKKEYIKHPQYESYELEFIPENREIFISNNLKLVVSCAKRYRNLGVPFEDLIQAGNVGLLTAFNKFDTSRNSLRSSIINAIESDYRVLYTASEATELLNSNLKYDDSTFAKTLELVPESGFADKDSFILWVKKNVRTAVFASVAFQWIKAYILQEIEKYSNTIRFPKSYRESEDFANIKICLDSINPYTDDNYSDSILNNITKDEFAVEDEEIFNNEKKEYFNEIISNALSDMPSLDRRVIKKKFGVGFPNALSNIEIAESEGISNNDVKNIINKGLVSISQKIPNETKKTILEMLR